MAKKIYQGYILNPQVFDEFVHNAQFQLDNVNAWMDFKQYENALIKAGCFLQDLKLVINELSKTPPIDPPFRTDSNS
jgi:hypothetical protein